MGEGPIIFNAEMVKAILEDRKTQARQVVMPKTSEVGEGTVDWAKFCWDGSEIHTDKCFHPNCQHKHEHIAPLPFVDSGFPNPATGKHDLQYLHVPYNWVEDCTIFRIYPKRTVGDRLWVRETFAYESPDGDRTVTVIPNETKIYYHATDDWEGVRVPSIHMPRWASRITLEITGIRVERVQEISWNDCLAEGVIQRGDNFIFKCAYSVPQGAFIELWDSLNKKRKIDLLTNLKTVYPYSWLANPWVWVISFKLLHNNSKEA